MSSKPMQKDKLKSFTARLFDDMAGAMTAGLAYLGTTTGLFRVMADNGAMSAEDLAARSGLQLPYVAEWLNGMAAAGYLDYDTAAETFELPEEHAFLLASDGSDHYAGGLFHMVPSLLAVAPRVADAFRDGGGVHFHDFGEHGQRALDLINRGNYEHRFAGQWLSSLPDVVTRLSAGGLALDVGCGVGRASIALAKAYPLSQFVGVDQDPESIQTALTNAAAEGVSDQTQFITESIEAMSLDQQFDLITACDCIHDFSAPVETLNAIRTRLSDDGTFFVIEPKAADRLEDNFHPIGTMFYGFSVFHCMTQSLAAGGPGLGTCMGPARARALTREAGFAEFEVLNISSRVNSFYAVRK